MIRPRTSRWHDYTGVFEDLRSGRLTYDEYAIMVDEDAIELRRGMDDDVVELMDEAKQREYDACVEAADYSTKCTAAVCLFCLCAPSPFLGREDVPPPSHVSHCTGATHKKDPD